MLLLILTVTSSILGLIATWYATGGRAESGDPVASVLVAIAIALLWSRGFDTLSRAYLTGQFDVVRRKLGLWRRSLGAVEADLSLIWSAVDARQPDSLEMVVETAERGKTGRFARVYAEARLARVEGDAVGAMARFLAGAETLGGADRAECYYEAALLLLQCGSDVLGGRTSDSAQREFRETSDLRLAIEYANRGEGAVREDGALSRARLQYLAAMRHLVRALIVLQQGRATEAAGRLRDIARRNRASNSLRARRVAKLAALELIWAERRRDDRAGFRRALQAMLHGAGLADLRVRGHEMLRLDEQDETLELQTRVRQQQQAQGRRDAEAAPIAGPERRLDADVVPMPDGDLGPVVMPSHTPRED